MANFLKKPKNKKTNLADEAKGLHCFNSATHFSYIKMPVMYNIFYYLQRFNVTW